MSDAFDKLAEDEANAMMRLLETPERKVLVFVVASEPFDGGQRKMTLCRAISDETCGADAQGFVQALDRERDRIASRLIKRRS